MNQDPRQTPPPRLVEQEESDLDIRRLLFTYLRNWHWIVLCVGIGFFCAKLYLRYTTPIYEVSGTVLIDEEQKSSLSQEAVVSELGFAPSSDVADELQILRSRDLMLRVVDSLGLEVSVFGEGRIKDSELYTRTPLQVSYQKPEGYGTTLRLKVIDNQDYMLLSEREDSLLGRFGVPLVWQQDTFVLEAIGAMNTGEIYRVEIAAPEQMAARYAGRLGVSQVEESSVIRLRLEDAVPEKAEDIINTLILRYNERVLNEKNEAGRNTLAFIDERLGFITEELYSVEQQVEGFKENNEMAVDLSIRAERYLEQLQTLDQQQTELQLKRDMLKKMSAYLDLDDFRSLPVSEELLGPTLNTLIQDYNQRVFERENFLETATPENPGVSTYNEQLEFMQSNIRLAIETMQENLNNQLVAIQERIQPLEERIDRVPSNERQLLQIMRQQQIKEQLFLFLLQKREETALSVAAQTADARVLDRPTQRGRVSPVPMRIYAIACMLGMTIPIGLISLRVLLDNKIRNRDDLEALTQIPFLGSIAQSKKKENIVVKKGSRSAIAEMFRLLRTNLLFNAAGVSSKVMLVTSSVSGEGKTFISINLGSSLALSGKKVILVGLDLRKPKLAQYLTGTKEHRGITNYLVGKDIGLDELIQQVPEYDNLFFLPCGPLPPNPAELLMTEKLQQALSDLKDAFDYVILDTSPVGLVTDALLLEDKVDQSIVVARTDFTTHNLVRMLNEVYRDQKLPRMGIVLNGVTAKQGYGYGKSYGYGYGYGYYSDDKKRKWWAFWN
jgi:capsular exopolysaccharide synthesis family protein